MFNKMGNDKIIKAIGIVWLLLWLSYIPRLVYYYPFHQLKGVKALVGEVGKAPDFIREGAGLSSKTPMELEEALTRELRMVWLESALIYVLGLLAAFLLLKKKQSGRILAIFFAAGMLLPNGISLLKHWRYEIQPKYWEMLYKYFPAQTIQNIITEIVLVTTLILLLRPSIAARFMRKGREHNTAFNPDAE